ncbi:concanavalin A-like lectin/glucanase domain-containing protein [Alternaria rosae]|uniref:concanavalin A-like lectin/glucanase domain-containing protein n=1 Tax=Alternaria rosae TaxID=1187941 RepID=UPI001E8E243A|nr:concanavalin A-like lectin/glucanase domain-containing protein [Alternaria rosae]KAH6878326.1 concanavalin A-like lectin/glucanase domain-containing protein [Alternaria rosae]
MAILRTLLVAASVVCLTTCYELKAEYNASNFFDDGSFHFYNGWDKFTQGMALYVSKEEATSLGLARIDDGKVHLGVDTTQVLLLQDPGEGYGRKSVRLEGVQTFNDGLFIADFEHLPTGCGMWPAFWLLHDAGHQEEWYSEFDIIEGVSMNSQNSLSLHTGHTPCKMRDNGGSGETRPDLECMEHRDCGVNGPKGSFGQVFNDNRGGIWATQVEDDSIKAWFFARGREPSGWDSANPDPSTWGMPLMNFVGDGCDIRNTFKKIKIARTLNLIINITFCGSMAGGNAWSDHAGCAAKTHDDSCNHFVATNPGKFNEVYYLINSVRVYQNGDGAGYQDNSLPPSLPRMSMTLSQDERFSAMVAEQSLLPVVTITIITTTKIITLPATLTHGFSYVPYDPTVSATAPTTFEILYGQRVSEVAAVAAPTVVTGTTVITSTKVMTLPATLTGGKNEGPYNPSASSTTLTPFRNKRLLLTASEVAPTLDASSTTSTKVVGTRTGGNNYSGYDPSAASTKPRGTKI